MSVRDPGLQPERTALSWRRTGWSMLVPCVLCLRGWLHTDDVLYLLSGMLLLVGSVAMLGDMARGRHNGIALTVVVASLLLIAMLSGAWR